jgi:putative NADH-flavin reductase
MSEEFKRYFYKQNKSGSLKATNLNSKDLNLNSNGEDNEQNEVEKKRILIFGATGGSGLKVIEIALSKGHKVIAAVRNPAALAEFKDKIEIRHIDLKDKNSIQNSMKDIDVVVSALGVGTSLLVARRPTRVYSDSIMLILDAMKVNGIRRGLFFTSSGVDHDDNAGWFYNNIIKPIFLMNTYMDMMKMETIIEIEGKSLDWTLVRPSYLTDSDQSSVFTASERLIKQGTYKISRLDVAKFIIHEIENNLWIHGYPALSY